MIFDVALNGKMVSVDTAGITKLGEAVEILADEHFGPAEIICSIRINNQDVPDEDVASLADMDLDKVETMELETIENPVSEVASQLGRMGKYLGSFETGLEDVADKLRLGEVEEANITLLQALDGLSAFVELLNNVQMVIKSDLASLSHDGITFSERQGKLLEITENMIKSQESQNWIAVADLIEYELAPAMKEWSDMIPLLESEISKSFQ